MRDEKREGAGIWWGEAPERPKRFRGVTGLLFGKGATLDL